LTTKDHTVDLDAQATALHLIVEILYRMYVESVADDGKHTGNAA
jgi:hypothetical protein